MGKTKTVFWGFFTLDYKAMEEYLEMMAEKGWILEKIGRHLAKFKAIEPQKLKFYVDIFQHSGGFLDAEDNEILEYRSICEESGWKFITSQGYLQFFYADPQDVPVPIQTDDEIEQKIVESTIWRAEITGILSFFFVLVLGSFTFLKFDYTKLLTFTGVTITFVYPLLAIPMFLFTCYVFLWMFKAKGNIRRGIPLEKPSLRKARIRGLAFHLSIALLVVLVLLSFIGDFFVMPGIMLIALIPGAVGVLVSFFLKKVLKGSSKTKKQKMLIAAVTMIVAVVVATPLIFSLGISSLLMLDDGKAMESQNLPAGYNVLRVEDFLGKNNTGIERSRFDKGMSPVVPRHYDYWEIDRNGVSVKTEYYQTITPYFARIIYAGELRDKTRHGQDIITELSDASGEAISLKQLWEADEVVFIRDTQRVLILRNNTVLYLEGDFDFSDAVNRKIVLEKILKLPRG